MELPAFSKDDLQPLLFVQGDVQRWGRVCTPASGMLRSREGHLMGLLRRVGELNGLGRGIL